MSFQREGVVFRATEDEAADFFCCLIPETELRLTLLDGDSLFGIYSEWKGQYEILAKIACQASLSFETALRYGYYSAVGYVCEQFENGQQTRNLIGQSDIEDNWGDGHLFEAFGYTKDEDAQLDDKIELAFSWGNDRWLLEHTPSYDRYR